MRFIVAVLALVVAVGCNKRPPAINEANAFKREVLAEAIADKRVRDQAYRQTVYEREKAERDRALEQTLALTQQVEMVDGEAFVRGYNAEGEEVREKLDSFVRRAIALADTNRKKIADAVAAETAADDDVNEKLLAALQLDFAIEQYHVAVEKGASAQDLNKALGEIIRTLRPILKE
jgi:hypothetical protein